MGGGVSASMDTIMVAGVAVLSRVRCRWPWRNVSSAHRVSGAGGRRAEKRELAVSRKTS